MACVPPTPGTRTDTSEEPAKGIWLQGLRYLFLDEATSSRYGMLLSPTEAEVSTVQSKVELLLVKLMLANFGVFLKS